MAATAISFLVVVLLLSSASFAADANWSRDDAAHLLRRAGFGGTPAQIDRLFALGRDGAVDYLITGKLPEKAEAPFAHAELSPFVPEAGLNYRQVLPGAIFELQKMTAWSLDRMVRSDRPLEEKMTLFWHGLFTSGYREVKSVYMMADQDTLLRREAIGNYKRLTHDIIHDGAMLVYLNNDQNLKGRPNENLARELMELFTMGEGNGYTEKDIPEVARALTGMTVGRFNGHAQFIERAHDDGAKTIFGKTGNYKPDDVVDLIFDRPEPATYLAGRLWQFFASYEPSEQDITLISDTLRKNNWDIAPALRVMFTSPAFYSDHARLVRIKSPVELEAMTLRLLEEPTYQRLMTAAAGSLRQTGEEMFQPPNVKGWPGGERWITSSAIFARYNIASAMANGLLGAGFGGRAGGFGFPRPAAKPAKTPSPEASGEARVAKAAVPATKPSGNAADPTRLRPGENNDARFARIQAIRDAQVKKIREELAAIPPLPPVSELVAPSKLFAQLGGEPTQAQLVDAAVARFLQQPLTQEKKATLIEAIGKEPLKLGDPQTDRRVRQMIGLILSTPEYQVE